MDIQMPVMDGIAATKELRSLGYRMPIIAATASYKNTDQELCFGCGMVCVLFCLFLNFSPLVLQQDIIQKPFTKQAVCTIVRRNLFSQTSSSIML